ncbi:MAG TPA: hypothetical protein VGO67_04860 [Verrucomicrobiae bacterium]|jgi:hypothetical protein
METRAQIRFRPLTLLNLVAACFIMLDESAMSQGVPSLNVRRSTNAAIVSWQSTNTGFTLETATNLNSQASWTSLTNGIIGSNGSYTYSTPTTGASDFFRLHIGSSLGQTITGLTTNGWTWVPFTNAFCLDGSTTGIGINPSTASSKVLIFLDGGGACWDQLTCYTLQSAVTSYNQSEFDEEFTGTSPSYPLWMFNRTNSNRSPTIVMFIFLTALAMSTPGASPMSMAPIRPCRLASKT